MVVEKIADKLKGSKLQLNNLVIKNNKLVCLYQDVVYKNHDMVYIVIDTVYIDCVVV